MPPIESKERIRGILETDRNWSLYALADLDDGYFEKCRWYAAADDGAALVLFYQGFDPQVMFAIGQADAIGTILDEVGPPHEAFLHIPVHILPLIEQRCLVRKETAMWRMMLGADSLRPVEACGAVRLEPADLRLLQRLYLDGDARAESPDFFDDSMVERGVYYGIREGDELIAVAGTHILSLSENAAGIGNVYTRRDRRGRGLAAATTSAVTSELLRMSIGTIGLNVEQNNAGATRIYERLGFVRHCPFIEGIAVGR